MLQLATLALDFLGSGVVTKGHIIEKSIRDAVQLQAMGEPNEMLKLYIGTTGLMHCGVSIIQKIHMRAKVYFDTVK